MKQNVVKSEYIGVILGHSMVESDFAAGHER